MCSSGGIGATGAGSSTAAAPDSTATSPAQICASSCSSSDQTALAQLGTTACAESATCVCTTLEGLSSSCQTCVLNTEFLTPADLQNECAPVLSNSGSAGAATGSPTQGAGSSAGAGGTTPTSAAGGSGGSGGSGASNSASGAAAASSSPAAPKSGALPSVDLRLAMVVLGGMLAGGMLLL
ncbi:hypothetical protein CALVIDRAFT_107520 [Calocera viscosa TUFC12733]|uniref:Uncharacterized protein n=1 Tax=Calocera viscosa (strain TUFC12733) TaxID=1330018 RepID=A0A167MBZ0_CALVF|nr:hypothetical protein CALVIDRAFT_107520 [Calocera viscosa TUFC12733]